LYQKYLATHKKGMARWRAAKRDEINKHGRDKYHENLEAQRQRTRNYGRLNPGKSAQRERNYRARKHQSEGTHSEADIKDIFRLQKGRCAACKDALSVGFHVDHVTALINGGGNSRDNLQILCPTCNFAKGPRDPIVFMQRLGFLL
jgi:5-methylcytosine-specific restriction endonuclease McrA